MADPKGTRKALSSTADDAAPPPAPRRRRPGGGRRRDPEIDARVLLAARDVYAELGWAGFHFDRVAKSAGVSRDVLYRRYTDQEALLLDALADATLPTVAGEGPIRDRLMTYARDIYTFFTSADGISSLRIHLEARQFPELYERFRSRVVDPNFEVNITALNEAAHRGDLRETADPVAVLEAIGGGVLIHALFSQHAGAVEGAAPLSPDRLEAALRSFVALALDE
ncbi:MAG TPA: TetR-like C-terminal domain-containing protein [Mycobacterium sp.]|nr:TetR-like C-terminal domain-containing protein [Mycobacterium sp.]